MNEEEERLMYISISPHKSIQLFKPVWKCFFLKQESFLVIQFNMCFTYGTHFQSWTFLYPPAFCLREVLAHTDTAWGHDLLLYCPHLEEREERPILKMASNGGILSSSTKIFRREKSFEYMCVYTNDALKIITVVIIFSDCNHDRSVPNVGVALRQIASSISVPTSNKSPISLLYCNCIQMIWWSDDDADDFNALGA